MWIAGYSHPNEKMSRKHPSRALSKNLKALSNKESARPSSNVLAHSRMGLCLVPGHEGINTMQLQLQLNPTCSYNHRFVVTRATKKRPGLRLRHLGFMNTGIKIQDSGCRIQDSGCKTQDSVFSLSGFRTHRIHYAGCNFQNSAIIFRDSGFRIQDSKFIKTGFRIQDSGFRIHQDSELKIQDSGHVCADGDDGRNRQDQERHGKRANTGGANLLDGRARCGRHRLIL